MGEIAACEFAEFAAFSERYGEIFALSLQNRKSLAL